jgi:hypothetical protein
MSEGTRVGMENSSMQHGAERHALLGGEYCTSDGEIPIPSWHKKGGVLWGLMAFRTSWTGRTGTDSRDLCSINSLEGKDLHLSAVSLYG